MKTLISKDYRKNWKAESEVELTDTLVLSITTSKSYNGQLLTTASVGRRDGIFISHSVFGDFSKFVEGKSYPRITAKVVEKQHNDVIDQIDNLIALAKKHYNLAA
jgi:hypothetical protein